MNFIIKEYDPYEDALQQFLKFNAMPAEEREVTEQQLIRRLSDRITADQA
jgi:hypothetical protein